MLFVIEEDNNYNEVTVTLLHTLNALIQGTEKVMTENKKVDVTTGISWDDVNEGGSGVLLPPSTIAGTLVAVIFGVGVDDYQKTPEEAEEYKGVKFIFAHRYEGRTEYLPTFYERLSLTPKANLTKIMKALLNQPELDITTLKGKDILTVFEGLLGTQLMLTVVQKGKQGKEYNVIDSYAASNMQTATGQIVLAPKNLNIPDLKIPDFFFKDIIDCVAMPSVGTVAQPVAPVAQAPVATPQPVAPVVPQPVAPAPVNMVPQQVVQPVAPVAQPVLQPAPVVPQPVAQPVVQPVPVQPVAPVIPVQQ